MTEWDDPDLLQRHRRALAEAGVPSPDHDLRRIGEHLREQGGGAEELTQMVARRVAREPLQLVLGHTWFRNVRIACAPGVFIPRPETEVVAGLAIDACLALDRPAVVVEPGTGTGAITCALLTEVAGVRVVATELEINAARLASRNVADVLAGRAGTPPADGVSARVHGGSLLDPVPVDLMRRVDVLVSNPPYLPAVDIGTWDAEVADNDPLVALVGGPHGNELVDELVRLAARWLRRGGTFVCEVDPRLAAAAAATAREVGLVDVRVVPDLTGRDRTIVARRPST